LIKRLFDFVFSFLALLLLAPLLIFLAMLLRVFMGAPVLFSQVRPGMHEKYFIMWKFRTMTNERSFTGELLPDSARLTFVGRLLRSTSLDELPQLWNVLKGDMSLVGPRPLLTEYLSLYSPVQARRHEMRPGITGWAQVNGRNALTWEERFRLDVWYVDNQSFWLDLKILFLTLRKILVPDGINASGEETMPRFTGSHTNRDR
jgi:sugar transferase EpsL